MYYDIKFWRVGMEVFLIICVITPKTHTLE